MRAGSVEKDHRLIYVTALVTEVGKLVIVKLQGLILKDEPGHTKPHHSHGLTELDHEGRRRGRGALTLIQLLTPTIGTTMALLATLVLSTGWAGIAERAGRVENGLVHTINGYECWRYAHVF